jgi:predicted Zn-dependent protease
MNQDVRLALLRPGTLAVLSWHEQPVGSSGVLRAAIGSGDADIKLQAALAQALIAEQQWQAALDVLDPLLGSRSEAGYFHGLRGNALRQLARDEASEGAMARALKYAGDHPVVLWWAFDARWGAGDRAGSQAVIEAIESLGIDGPRLAGVLLAQRPLRE